MGSFGVEDVDHYGGSGGAGFFKLENHGDKAQVRFLYSDIKDVQGYAVHRVKVSGSKWGKDVNCLRNYNDPVDVCPFCREKYAQEAKLYIPLYNLDEDKYQIWSRGKKWFQKISSLCSRYPNLVSHIFEIERNGKANDQQTTYEVYEIEQDDTTLEDFDNIPDPLKGAVLNKTAEDMEYYIQEGEFPPEEDEEEVEEHPRRRTTSNNSNTGRRERRTPSTNRRNEVF